MAEPVRAADPAPAGAATHVIPVHFDDTTHALTVTRPAVLARPGDTIVWAFAGAPAGYVPWIEFRPAESGDSFGPLASLNRSESAAWGICPANQPEGVFLYRAVLQKGHLRAWENEGSSYWSRTNTVEILSAGSGQEKLFTIQLDPSTQKLFVSPDALHVESIDTVLWSFPPESAGWVPRVTFFQYDGDGTVPNLQLGPFTTLNTGTGQVRGMGSTGIKGIYHFEVALVSASTGEVSWVNSGDPVIDNRGGVVIPPDPEPDPDA